MAVRLYVPVETLLSATDGNFFDHPGLGKYFEISVDGGQAYSREFSLDPLKKFIRRGVKRGFLEFLEDDFPLMGHAKLFCHNALDYHLLFFINCN